MVRVITAGCWQVTSFDENQTAFTAEGLMLAEVGAAHPAASRVAAVLIGEHAFHHKNFFAAKVAVWVEEGAGCPTHHGGVLGAIVFLLLEEFLSHYTIHWQLGLGAVLLGVVLLAPNGLTSLLRRKGASA